MKSFVGERYSVYMHANKNNGKVYIGQTCCEDLTRRWCGGHGYKANSHFYRAILKNGWDNFTHEILETGLTAEEANDRERYYIALYQSTDPSKGYNIRSGGAVHTEFSEAGMRNLREHFLGSKNPVARPVSVFDLSGKLVASFECAKYAADFLRVSTGTLGRHLTARRGTCGGFIARYTAEVEGIVQLPTDEIYFVNEQRSRLRPVAQYSLDGQRLGVFKSIKAAALAIGVRSSDISSCLSGEQRTACGFMWRYAQDAPENIEPYRRVPARSKPVGQYEIKTMTKLKVYPSITAAAAELGVRVSTLQSAACGRSKTSCGYIWQYEYP
nr:MAG TPA: intron associated endonuclease [Caudoviricetes sp.]